MASNIYFQRKRDIDIDYKQEYTHYINLEKMGQIIYSILGYPHRATSGKSRIFDKHYSLVYRNSEIDFTKCPEYVKKYYEIKNVYISLKYDVTDQKLFYILYILYNTTKKYKNLEELVECFEEQISNYKHTKDISDSRKLILLLFKERVDKELI